MSDPRSHRGRPALTAGAGLEEAVAAMILVHGRGATAHDILYSCADLVRPDVAFLAPQATGNEWYPFRFLEPLERNQPWLDSALETLSDLLEAVGGHVSPDRVLLLGFSQGACLALEFAARNARRYGGLVGLSGGLIGPEGTPRDYAGSLAGTPVLLGCSDVDPHIPAERVIATAEVLSGMGGEVDLRLYPGMGHDVNQDEIERVREMLALAAGRATGDRAGTA